MDRPHNDKEWKQALKLIDRLAKPKGDWRDDETRRLARKFLKKWKTVKTHSSSISNGRKS